MYTYVCIYKHIHTYIYANIYVYIYTSCAYIYTYIHTHIHCTGLLNGTVCYSFLCTTVCCSVLQCVAERCGTARLNSFCQPTAAGYEPKPNVSLATTRCNTPNFSLAHYAILQASLAQYANTPKFSLATRQTSRLLAKFLPLSRNTPTRQTFLSQYAKLLFRSLARFLSLALTCYFSLSRVRAAFLTRALALARAHSLSYALALAHACAISHSLPLSSSLALLLLSLSLPPRVQDKNTVEAHGLEWHLL